MVFFFFYDFVYHSETRVQHLSEHLIHQYFYQVICSI